MSIRRLSVLFEGLPPEAAIWRRDLLPPAEEFAAIQIERMEAWMNAVLQTLLRKKTIDIPGQMHIPRPGQVDEPRPKNVVSIDEYAALTKQG